MSEINPSPIDKEEISQTKFLGMLSASGTKLLESPNMSRLEELLATDKRIVYFRFHMPQDIKDKNNIQPNPDPAPLEAMTIDLADEELDYIDFAFNGISAPENLFHFYTLPALTEYLANKYQDQEIGLRGTATAVADFPIKAGDVMVKDPLEILQFGTESGGDSAPMTGFKPWYGKYEIASRSLQWLFQHPRQLREEAGQWEEPSDQGAIFPALLVYDRTKFEEGTAALPNDQKVRAEVILEIIILDMPLHYQAIQKIRY